MATTDANGFITIENSDLFNISHANGNAAAASAVATRVTTAEGNISDIQTALGNKVDTSTYTSGMAGKVDKVDGKGLSTEDYTTAEKTKLAGIADGANNYSLPTASTNTLGGVKVGGGLAINDGVLSAGVYALPTASASTKGGIKVGNAFAMSSDTMNLKTAQINSIFSAVKLNGTTLNPSDYSIQQGAFAVGEPYPGMAVVTMSVFFAFDDERDISAGSKVVFESANPANATSASCIFACAALGGSLDSMEVCGAAHGEALSGITVYVTKTTKAIFVQATGIGYYKA